MEEKGVADEKLNAIDKKIAALQAERAELSDPKRQEVREAYGELERILDRLEDLGEDVTTHNGEVVTLVGTRFGYMHGSPIWEK